MAGSPTIISLLLVAAYWLPAHGLYEDQIGKFDWVQQYVGVVNHAVFDQASTPARRVIVATSQNVLAALSIKNGEIMWRHVMEEEEHGRVEAAWSEGSRVVVVLGNLVRSWDTVTAALLDEVMLDHTPQPGLMQRLVEVGDSEVLVAELVAGSVVVTSLDRSTGAALDHITVAAPWLNDNTKCECVGGSVVCVEVSLGLVFTLPLALPDPAFATHTLASLGVEAHLGSPVAVEKVPGAPDYAILQVGSMRKLIHVHDSGVHVARDMAGTRAAAVAGDTLYTITQTGRLVTIEGVELESGNTLADQTVEVELPPQSGVVLSLAVHRFERRDGGTALRAFVTCSDHAVHLISSAGVIWSREEALASVVATEAVDLPADASEVNYHDHLSPHEGLVGSFVHRIRTQCSQLSHWVRGVVGSRDSFQASMHALERDQLNLRKLLVMATTSGKILGVDSWSGDVVWSIFAPHLAPLPGHKLLLYTQRSSAHFPHHPQCAVVGRHKVTGEGMVVVFNPILGTGVGERGGIHALGYTLAQVFLLHHPDDQFLKPLLLVDSEMTPHTFPASGEGVVLEHKDSTFLHLARPGSSTLTGYTLRLSTPGALRLSEIWSVSFLSGAITGVHGKLAAEKVHSPGRVLADRSVLYKYVNPNLAVVTTQGYDHVNKNTLTVYLVDTVTGAVIESVSHKRVSGPVHVVHSENWVVYTFFNDKYRRFEVTSLELYEGPNQVNATAFSSFGGRATPPILERQAFIMPVGVQATAHTNTEKGITTKFILFGLQSGAVLQMSKWLLDPRRPVTGGPREEGLLPYIPELRLPPQEMITYNHTLPRITAIYTAPTGLESACLVLVYGLDLFYTRLFPSKMFDVLKDDFDHYLIVGALLALVAAAVITKKLSQRKQLKQAWK